MNDYNREKILSYIFKQLGFTNLDQSNNDDHIKQHKLIFLLQRYGVSVGIGYTWKILGPYSPEMDYYIGNINNDVSLWDSNIESHFNNKDRIDNKIKYMLVLLSDIRNDAKQLTLLSSIVFIRMSVFNRPANFNDTKKQLEKTMRGFDDDTYKKLFKLSDEFIHL